MTPWETAGRHELNLALTTCHNSGRDERKVIPFGACHDKVVIKVVISK